MTPTLIPLLGLVSPFFIWIVEHFVPYPYIVEELLKTVVVYYLVKNVSGFSSQLKKVILFALLFTFSETIFFFTNIVSSGVNLFFERILFTGILHTLTVVILLVTFRKNIYLGSLGLLCAMIIHYMYNSLI